MNKETDDAVRLACIDTFMIEAILSSDVDTPVDDAAVVAARADFERAKLLARKGRLQELRDEIDRERASGRVVSFDEAKIRARLSKSAVNDPGLQMTLAARSGKDGIESDMHGLLEDFAELEEDARDNPTE